MNIRSAAFNDDNIEARCMGAGVIPLSRGADGKPYLLLGRERWIPSWRGSCRWSGFEGSRKATEEVVRAATREFFEESMGVVNVEETAEKGSPASSVFTRLRLKQYWRRIVLRVTTGGHRADRYHCTYVIPVAHDSNVVQRFATLRTSIEHADRVLQEWRHLRPPCLGYAGEHIGPLEEHDDGGVTVYKRASTAPCILRPPWRAHTLDIVAATFTDPTDVHAVRRWYDLRGRVERAVVAHPAMTVVRDPLWRHVQEVTIHRDHLEKDQIRWWSLRELDAVIAGQGHIGRERFRPYFLPVLQTILHELHGRNMEEEESYSKDAALLAPRCEPCVPDPEDATAPSAPLAATAP